MRFRQCAVLVPIAVPFCAPVPEERAADPAPAEVAAASTSPELALRSGSSRQLVAAAVDACVVEFRDLTGLVDRLRAAGWTITPFGDGNEFEVGTAGAGGYVSTDPAKAACSFGELASLSEAQAIGNELVARRFPNEAQPGAPEGGSGPCDGYTIFPGRGLIVISYDGLGNDPVCPDPNGANIVVTIST